jgi:hypothetical protein
MVFGEVPPFNSVIPGRNYGWEIEVPKMVEPPEERLEHIKSQLLSWLETDRGKDRMLLTDTFRPSMLACRDLESVRLLLSQQVYATKPSMRVTPTNIEWYIKEADKTFGSPS